jgi:hypothetical protein
MAGFGDFQIFRPDLLGVVTTSEMICDIGAAENKSLSYYREYLEVSQIILISKLRSKMGCIGNIQINLDFLSLIRIFAYFRLFN